MEETHEGGGGNRKKGGVFLVEGNLCVAAVVIFFLFPYLDSSSIQQFTSKYNLCNIGIDFSCIL